MEEKHSEASKKEIARATFLSVILSAEYDPEDTQALHDLAMETETTRRPERMTSSIGLSSSPFDHAHIRAAEVNWDDIRVARTWDRPMIGNSEQLHRVDGSNLLARVPRPISRRQPQGARIG